MTAAPTLFWFDRADGRIGVLHPTGAVEHREELGGEDVLSFPCLELPEKYDRALWRDPEDGRWREHVVVRTDESLDAPCEVYAESSLCDLLAGYVEEERIVEATLAEVLGAVLGRTRWTASVAGAFGVGGAYLFHVNRLAALRRACEVWGCEIEPTISASGGRVSARAVRAVVTLCSWHGARLEFGRNMAGCTRTVRDDDVFTALFGYGAGLPVIDETGAFTGGYRRKPTFGEVNGGVNWIGDDEARQLWGLPGAGGSRVHRFGEVTFSDVEDPAWRIRARVVRRMRLFGDAMEARYSVGAVRRTAYAERSAVEARVAVVEDAAGTSSSDLHGPKGARLSSRSSLASGLRALEATPGRMAPRGPTAGMGPGRRCRDHRRERHSRCRNGNALGERDAGRNAGSAHVRVCLLGA